MPSCGQSLANSTCCGIISCMAIALYGLRQVGIRKSKKKSKEQISIEKSDVRPKVVVITGCDTGFGKLMAEAWSTRSSESCIIVVALTLTEKGVDNFHAYNEDNKNEPSFHPVVAIRCDVASASDVSGAKARIESIIAKENAVLYAIVNNAGIADPGDFVFYNDLTIPKRVMDVNFFGQLAVTQALLPMMLATSKVVGGKIVNMSSICGASTGPNNSIYCASKFAIEAWSDALRMELEGFNIEVTKIRPGIIGTSIQEDYYDRYAKNYESAPKQIQALYGGKVFAEKIPKKPDTAKMAPPSVVVDTITEVLFSGQKLRQHYLAGNDAHTLWKAMTIIPSPVYEMVRNMVKIKPEEPKLPPPNTLAYVTIRVREMERSLEFYKALGFETIGPLEGRCQFIQFNPSNNGRWESLVLLKEDRDMPERSECYHVGMTRLCILTIRDLEQKVEDLRSKHGIEPIAPMGISTMSGMNIKHVVFRDPDGFIVYFDESNSLLIKLVTCWTKKKLPCLLHWSINVTDSKHAMAYFEKLGFRTASDQNKDQILKDMLPSFRLDPENTVIERVRMCRLPRGGVLATIMEWVTPKSIVNESSASNAMTLSVTDVRKELEKAKEAGLILEENTPVYHNLPIFGQVLVGKAYLEKGSNPIEFCCFSNQKP